MFALENLVVLKSLTQRLAIQQMVEVAEELEKALPRRVKRKAPSGNRTPTQVEDEDQYPIGGFSAMSTSGSIENLVTSELIYMDEVPDPESVDLFDLRYVEGELLYYTRDESVFVRSRRVVTFVLPPSLVEARFKDPGVRWQRIVVVFGAILSLVRRMSEWLSEEGLLFRIAFVKDGSGAISGYQGSANEVSVDIDGSLQVTVAFNGEALARGAEADDLFTVMDRAIAAARAGDVDALTGAAADLQRAFERATLMQGRIGASLRFIDDDKDRLAETSRATLARISSLEDTNMAAAVSGMTQAETAYRAALGAAAQVQRVSLMDYLR